MPRGSKDAYTDKQKRKAEHIEKAYEKRGTSKDEAERRAWATVNKESGGGKKSGSGRGKKTSDTSNKKGGKTGGAVPRKRTATKKAVVKKSRAKSPSKKATAKKPGPKKSAPKKIGRPRKPGRPKKAATKTASKK